MFVTILACFGGYVLIGLLFSLVGARDFIAWIKDPEESVYNELCGAFVALVVGWPLVVPSIGYLAIAHKIFKRFELKSHKQYKGQVELMSFLCNIGAISDETHIETRHIIVETKSARTAAYRKKLKI